MRHENRSIDFPRLRHPAGCRAGQPGRLFSPAIAISPSRVRQILRAGDVVRRLPDKAKILCPCGGHLMTFFHALRTRARPPPLQPLLPASSCANVIRA